jgi:hypothetical protein
MTLHCPELKPDVALFHEPQLAQVRAEYPFIVLRRP